MTAEELKELEGKYLYDDFDHSLICLLKVIIDGVWVSGYGHVIYCNGVADFETTFDIGTLDIDWMDETYGKDKWSGKDDLDSRYLLDTGLSVVSNTKAKKLFNERIKEIKDYFGF